MFFFTFAAVFATPSGEAHLVTAGFRAGVVAKFVVTRAAEISASVAVVMLVALDPVTIVERM